MTDFRLSEAEWSAAATELEKLGRENCQGDREELETICGTFVACRTLNGKRLSSPTRQAKSWGKIEVAAQRLGQAISELSDDPQAAEVSAFLGLDALARVEEIASQAQYMARIEMLGPKQPTASDPDKDWLIQRLIQFWEVRGGKAKASVSPSDGQPRGPLIRFLAATYGPCMVCSGLSRPNPNKLRDEVRKYQAYRESMGSSDSN